MIQELLSGNNHVSMIGNQERSKLSNPPRDGSPSASSAAAGENLRCPRCDSANTKFCYYNNYNLTQPRHFCKTCRRYWTKGGALRNVPIGGGCRKNKTAATITAAVAKSSAAAKFKTASFEMASKTNSGLFIGLEQSQETLSANPSVMWGPSQSSHFLSLIRPNQNPNYPNNHLPTSLLKEEGNINIKNNLLFGSSAHLRSDQSSISRVTGLDTLGPAHLPPSGLANSPYRNQSPVSGQAGFIEIQNNGLQELYQRLRSTTTNCYPDNHHQNAPVNIVGNMGAAQNYSTTAILESAPVGTGELGFWNQHALSWPTDLPTTNGAYL